MQLKDPLFSSTESRVNAVDRITVAYGDGIGGEIMEATLSILKAANVNISYDEVVIGEKLYKNGHTSGINAEAWDILRRNPVFLKGPITTPQGGGYKSLNVTIRKTLGLFANVRPCMSYSPYVFSNFPKMDVVVIRENEEDLYAGIEHQQTSEVVQCLKLISRPGCERIIRYAFEYARAHGRKKVTCMTKDNIMKHTDGLFHEVFNQVAKEYSDIASDHYIVDIGTALIATQPDQFDVIVTLNLYGDIISDITAQLTGSVGLGGSANIGEKVSMFEAIHGSAPNIAHQDIANPSGLLHAACMMLTHIGKFESASLIRNAWLRTIEDGIHTGDLFSEACTRKTVGTKEFSKAVTERLGDKPRSLKETPAIKTNKSITINVPESKKLPKTLVGVDVFLDWVGEDRDPEVLGKLLEGIAGEDLQLKMITNRGVKVYPNGMPETSCTDHWRCRFVSASSVLKPLNVGMNMVYPVSYQDIIDLLERLDSEGLHFIKLENLYEIEGKRAYSLGQGE